MREIYFTFRAGERCGVTDQLMQFSAWYKLGRSLGYRYYHQPMACNRSGLGIFEFLGFDALWNINRIPPNPPVLKVELPLSLRNLRFPFSCGYPGLLWFIRRCVGSASRNSSAGTLLVEFRLIGPRDRGILRLIESAVPTFPDGLELRQCYFARRAVHPRLDLYKAGTRRVLVHIRQGDVAVLPTPWGTYLSVRSRNVSEYPSLEAGLPEVPNSIQKLTAKSLQSYVDPHEYFKFLRSFMADHGSDSHSIVVSSDGFARTFAMINRAATDLGLSAQQLAQLAELEVSYERSKFREFSNLPNVRLLLGETEENLFDLIHSALTADIIVTSRQQRMMLKLLALYGRKENPPMLVVLYRGAAKPAHIKNQLGSRIGKVVAINVKDLAGIHP